jgi:DNA recombination protein RmuC
MSEIGIWVWVSVFLAGSSLLWVLRVADAKAAVALAQARLATCSAQLAEQTRAKEALRLDCARMADLLRAEIERRACAETTNAQVAWLRAKLDAKERLVNDQQAKLAELEARIAEERETANEKLKLVADAEAALLNAFKALSADALKHNNQSFVQLATTTLKKLQENANGDLQARQKAVDAMVLPICESLQKVDGKLSEIEKGRIEGYSALHEQLKGLVEAHFRALHGQTANFVDALRQPAARGRWGELQLKRVVEMAGMLEHCDFIEQENVATEAGRLQPDMIVKLPGGRTILIDAKAPVAAYFDAIESSDELLQRQRFAQHALEVRTHITALGQKRYCERSDSSAEFVVMFIPGEVFFSAALQQDPALVEFGTAEKVIPAAPTTLIALLRAVSYGWRQEALAQNAQEVADLGKQLYERIVKLGEHWSNVGDKSQQAVAAY